MRVAITGVTGRLGAALARHHDRQGHEVLRLDRARLDLARPEALEDTLRALGHLDLFINPAALTSLEACEDDPALAQRVNGDSPALLARHCRKNHVRFLHVSTDYVFDGQGARPLVETDPANPINHYGRTKHAGEEGVLAEYPDAWVARVSWVFGPDKPGFPETILDRQARGEPLVAVADKVSCPSYVNDLAWAFDQLLALPGGESGLIHLCNPGPVTWHGYAEEILRCKLGGERPENSLVTPCRLADMKAFRAARPAYTAMSTSRFHALTGRQLRPWTEALAEYLDA